MMRIMAIDAGDMRTGIALSDLTGTMAGETFVLTQPDVKKLAEAICAQARERDVREIVVGNPLNMNGTEGERSAKSRALADMLSAKSGLPVRLWDERRTTVDAARILHASGRHGKKNRARVDAVAAALILEGYLGSLKK